MNNDCYVSVVIAEDYGGQLLGFKQIVEQIGYCRVVGLASNGEEALRLVDSLSPDILITDINMPGKINGVELAEKVKRDYNKTGIIIITLHDERYYINRLLEIGVKSILLKGEYELEELKKSIDVILRGGEFYSPTLLKIIKNFYTSDLKIKLSPMEKEVLTAIASEYTTAEIAKKINLSGKAVENHRKNLFLKFGVKRVVGLVLKAKELGYLK